MATYSSDEVKLATTELCDPCFSNCKEILAVLYCLDCDEKLCEVCGTCHKKSKLSKDHKLSKVTEAPPGDVVKLLKELTTCPNHQSEEVVYVCIDEDQLFCNQCANTRHRQCRQLETIEQYMTNTVHKDTFEQMNYEIDSVAKNISPEETVLENLNKLDQHLAEILKHDANERSMVADSAARVTDYLQAVQAKLELAVKSLKTEVISQREMQTCVLLQNIDDRQKTTTNLRDQINTDRDNIDAIKQHGNNKHVFLLRRKITKEIQDIESRTRQLNKQAAAAKIEVVEQTSVENIVLTIKGALRVQTSGLSQRAGACTSRQERESPRIEIVTLTEYSL